jgi:3-oxoacyl-[acyl-carrier protein] reductase
MGILDGKTAIVTGSGRGIGRQVALNLAKNGADIVICDINEQDIESTVKEIKSMGRNSEGFKVDVSNTDEVNSMIQKMLDNFKKIDILVNNAGITRDNLLMRMSEEDWDLVLKVNLKGVFNFTKAVLRPMMKQRQGKIVNIASIIGLMGNAGQANYAASKGGVIAFTKSIAKEVASRNINVNAIAPGFIQTEMTNKLSEEVTSAMLAQIPLKRFGSVDNVADLVMFLASEMSSYITGQVIKIDGGMVM